MRMAGPWPWSVARTSVLSADVVVSMAHLLSNAKVKRALAMLRCQPYGRAEAGRPDPADDHRDRAAAAGPGRAGGADGAPAGRRARRPVTGAVLAPAQQAGAAGRDGRRDHRGRRDGAT